VLEQLASVHWLSVFLFAAWILPVPYFVQSNIDALVNADIGLSELKIKISATVFGFLWPYLMVRGILQLIFGPRK